MPIKLTSSQYKVIGIAVVVAALSLGIAVKYFWRAFPEATLDLKVGSRDSEPIALNFLASRGIPFGGFQHAAIFDYDDQAKLYLERTQGLDRMNQLTRGPIRLWRWTHRWFRPQQKEEFRVEVTPQGEVVGFEHEIPEAALGASLDAPAARTIAEDFLRQVMKRDLADLEFVEVETQKRPARTDHTFTWKQKSVNLGDGSLRIEMEIDGDQVDGYREFVKIPEQWSRDYDKLRSRNDEAQIVDQVFWVLLSVAMAVLLIQRLRDRDVPVRMALGFGGVAAVLYFLGQLNTFSLAQFGYSTTDSYSSFVTTYWRESFLSAAAMGTGIFFLTASSEPVYREAYPRLISIRRYLTWNGLRTRSFLMANVVGLAMTFFFFGYQTVFYFTANRLGAWAPSDVPFTNELNTRIPWVSVLFMGFFPAVMEEMQFRAFSIPFLGKILRSKPVAVVLSAFVWSFLHSTYPNQPFFIRGLEVGIGGIIIGVVMLRFGIMATLIWHYSVDALYTAFLLLRSSNHYLILSGGITGGIMLIPLVWALVAYWRTGTFVDESTLTNASEGIARAEHGEAVTESGTPLAYQPLAQSRLMLAGVLTAILVASAFVRVHPFGEGIKVRITRLEAMNRADAFLKGQGVNIASYRRVAWIEENVDPLAVRYLLERRSVIDTDHIYRQATRLALWHVRYFQPLQKEEYLVFIDPGTGEVFSYRHLIPEDAPGATLTPEQAQALAEQAVTQQGYQLSGFDRQETEAQKRKNRQDYTLTWQAKSGDPRNVGEMHYRLAVSIAGDQVVGFQRYFKIPEEWSRQREGTRLSNSVLKVILALCVLAITGGLVMLLVIQVRSGAIPWRASAKVGAVLGVLMGLSNLAELSVVERQYPTSIPLNAFRVYLAVSFVVIPLVVGLLSWLLVGLVASVYPDAWRVLRASSRRIWRRDAAIATAVVVSATFAMSRLMTLVADRFHAFAPVRIDFLPPMLDSFLPGAGFFVRALYEAVFLAAAAGLLIYGVRFGLSRRAWWLWASLLLLLVSLGPTSAHSVREFALGGAMTAARLAVDVVLVALFFRDNVLAYLMAAFCINIAEPLAALFSQSSRYYQYNGLLLAGLSVIMLACLLLGGGERAESAFRANYPPPVE